MFVDEIQVFARAGRGGKGCVAFHREASRPKGGPSGGNGGRGGDVILQADHDLNNLINQYYRPSLIAEDGEGGMGKGMDGHAGKDLLVKVPCGTLVWRLSPKGEDAAPEADDPQTKPDKLMLSSSRRPLIRRAGSVQAVEIDLAHEAEKTSEVERREKG